MNEFYNFIEKLENGIFLQYLDEIKDLITGVSKKYLEEQQPLNLFL